MKITFLGTGTSQGVPIIGCKCKVCLSENEKDKRLRSSILIESKGKVLVVDSGPDFRQQMLRARVDHLDGILFSHGHKDHVAGLDDVRAYNYIQKSAMNIYAETSVIKVLKAEFSYVFTEDKYPGVPEIDIHIIDERAFHIDDVEITPIRAMHYKLPVLGFRLGEFAYLTDVNFIPDDEYWKLKDLDVLVINALRKEKHISHYSLSEALEIIEKFNPKTAFLTHISHQMGLHDIESSQLPNNVYFAFDGFSFICSD